MARLEEIPPESVYLVRTWQQLRTGDPVEYREIEAYCKLRRVSLEPWEVDAIMRLDRMSLAVSMERKGDDA